MGILDKAKATINKSFGDETVKVVSYDEEIEKQEKPVKAPKEPRVKKEREPKPARAPKPPKVKTESIKMPTFARKEPDPEPEVYLEEFDDSSFDLEEAQTDYFDEQEEKYVQAASKWDNDEAVQVSDESIKDVLETLNIPATFSIEKNIFMPEDLKKIDFDLQAPIGYDQGQVNSFVAQVVTTVSRYVELLRMRNEHVIKLASTVDRLQFNNTNLKYQNEISNGLTIMPTTDHAETETQLVDAKLRIRNLEDQLKTAKTGNNLSNTERQKYESLQDRYSISQREIENLREQLDDARGKLALYVENDSDELDAAFEEIQKETPKDVELPSVDDFKPEPAKTQEFGESAFLIDDDDSDKDSNDIHLLPESSVDDFDMDENELEKMMKDWGSN